MAHEMVAGDPESGDLVSIATYLLRFAISMATAGVVLAVDVLTKEADHEAVLLHYRHITPLEFVAVALFLLALAIYRSNLLALAAGLLFGALCGNGGELLLHGYATDWLRVGRWLTNVADLAVVGGLACICADIVLLWCRRWCLVV
jgi:hypothetical protein